MFRRSGLEFDVVIRVERPWDIRQHTLLGYQFDLRNEPNISWRGHGMLQKNAALTNGTFITKDDGSSCSQTHPT